MIKDVLHSAELEKCWQINVKQIGTGITVPIIYYPEIEFSNGQSLLGNL